uniref:Uncharacterized protein n=1 Tax=Anopheles darlingi TaxID=43151 RepID=A0A2M4DAX9_ANODA
MVMMLLLLLLMMVMIEVLLLRLDRLPAATLKTFQIIFTQKYDGIFLFVAGTGVTIVAAVTIATTAVTTAASTKQPTKHFQHLALWLPVVTAGIRYQRAGSRRRRRRRQCGAR